MKFTAAVNQGRAKIVALCASATAGSKGSIAKLQVSLHSNTLSFVMHSLPAGCCFGDALVHTPAEQTLIHLC